MSTTDYVYVTYIQSTPQKVWDALTQPEFTRQYWAGMENRSDWNVGSKWEHCSPADSDPWVIGEVTESEPPHRLSFTWKDPDDMQDTSKVLYEIEKLEENLVSLTVKHYDFKPDSAMRGKISQGWPRVLSSLKSYLETGKSLNLFCKNGAAAPATA